MSEQQTPIDPATPVLQISGATLMRGGSAVLENINLEIAQGEHTAILGPNGSGKSSLIKMVTREVYPLMPANGHPAVQIFGRAQWDVSELRSLVGIVTSDLHQTFTQAGGLTGMEAVLSGFFGSVGLARHLTITGEMRDRSRETLHEMGALALADRPMEYLSSGQARRVLIARALVMRPHALLLDEPTTGLDLAATHHFLETIRAVMQRGVTLLLVTHHAEEIIPEIQRVVLLREGRIFRDGAKADILNSKNMTALFGVPVAVGIDRRRETFHAQVVAAASRFGEA